jgi:hypothetical protein
MHLSRQHAMINILVHARRSAFHTCIWLFFCSRESVAGLSATAQRAGLPIHSVFGLHLMGLTLFSYMGPETRWPFRVTKISPAAWHRQRHRPQGPTRQRHAPTRCSCSAACFSHRRHPLERCWRNLIAPSAHLKPYYHLRQRGGSRPWRRRRRRWRGRRSARRWTTRWSGGSSSCPPSRSTAASRGSTTTARPGAPSRPMSSPSGARYYPGDYVAGAIFVA